MDFRKEYLVDLFEFFTPEREIWEFWALFNALPDGSATKSAISLDEEIAKQQVAHISEEEIERISESRANPGSQRGNLSLKGYSLEIEKMNQIIDAVNILRVTIKTALGGKTSNSDFQMAERPKTAFEKEIDKRVMAYEKRFQKEAMSDFGF